MPTMKRHWTDYPGVYFIEGKRISTEIPERIYYVKYRTPEGKVVEEKAGRATRDRMTPAKAAGIRGERMSGKVLPNAEQREKAREEKAAEAERWTFSKLWEEYKIGRPDAKRSSTDQTNFTKYLLPDFGDKEPREILPLDVDRLRRTLSKKKTEGTVKNVLELLRRLSNFAEKKYLSAPLPFRITLPRVNNIRTEDLTPEQMTRLLEVLQVGIAVNKDGKERLLDQDAREMMHLALFTGMRRGEILRLRWDDVDFERGFIRLVEPKGGVDQTIPMSDGARELLSNRPRTESTFVFPGRFGGQRQDAAKSFRAIRKAAGLPDHFRPMHGLRHTFASHLASSGKVDLYTLQRLLTHKSPMMTQRYAHLTDTSLRRAANVMSQIVQEAEGKKVAEKNE